MNLQEAILNKMDSTHIESPVEEQDICVECGLCCDGTLFKNAILQPGEQGGLPELIETAYAMDDNKEFFMLPCSYFCKKCTIYDQKKPSVCSDFRCRLLKNFSKGFVSKEDAIKIVSNVISFRTQLYQEYKRIFGYEFKKDFRAMVVDLDKEISSLPKDNSFKSDKELLLMKCMIFDTLLTKNFKSTKQFESLLAASEE